MPHVLRMSVSTIIKRAGGVVAVARVIDRHPSTISGWRRIPAVFVVDIAHLARMSPEQVRPDIFREPRIDRRMEGGAA